MIKNVEYDDGTKFVDADWEGLVTSFVMSVGNNSKWANVVQDSVGRCYSQFSESDEYDCNGQIPLLLYRIIDCSYVENYLRCPTWNPYDIMECNYTSQYVDQCYSQANFENNYEYDYY